MNLEDKNIIEDFLGKPNEGFIVPEGYFEQLQKNVLAKTTQNGFAIPENYFDTLESNIQKRINETKIIHHNFAFKQLAVGVAASLIFIAGFFIVKNKFSIQSSSAKVSSIKLNNLNNDEIINSLEMDDIEDNNVYATSSNINYKSEDYLFYNSENIDDQDLTEQL